MIAVDLVLPYNAVHSIQQTEQIPNDPLRMGAKSAITSNHPTTPTHSSETHNDNLMHREGYRVNPFTAISLN